ncbi:MAG: hypothetical protein LIQ26_04525 [Bacteroidota bacterium]|nr:hypothetical protein [Bacteroidota bacterium]
MNRNNEYYLELVERWFDAETSEAEEKELKRFLATTEDPAFDEARAAFGYLAASSLRAEAPVSATPAFGRYRWLVPAMGMAAGLAIAFIAGRYTAPVEVVPVSNGSCVSYVHGVEVADEDFAVATMENTLQDLFSAVPDPRTDLTLIFNANE